MVARGATDRGAERQVWAGVFIRGNRLQAARDEFLHRKGIFRQVLERPITPEHLRVPVEGLRDVGRAAELLTYAGEVILLFADAATNALATAISFSYGDRDKTPSMRNLLQRLERERAVGYEPDLTPFVERMRRVYVSVNVPRHALAVHPPANASANGFHWDDDGRFYMSGWAESWDPEAEDWRQLSDTVKAELGKDFGGVPGSLIGSLLYELVDLPLSDATLRRLEDYVRRHGCAVSPERVCEVTLALLADVASEFGYDRGDFFSD